MFTVQIVIIALACALFLRQIFFVFLKRLSPFDSKPTIEYNAENNGFNFKKIRSKLFPSTICKQNLPSNEDLQSPYIPSFLRSLSIDKFKEKSSSNDPLSPNKEPMQETSRSVLNASQIDLKAT